MTKLKHLRLIPCSLYGNEIILYTTYTHCTNVIRLIFIYLFPTMRSQDCLWEKEGEKRRKLFKYTKLLKQDNNCYIVHFNDFQVSAFRHHIAREKIKKNFKKSVSRFQRCFWLKLLNLNNTSRTGTLKYLVTKYAPSLRFVAAESI